MFELNKGLQNKDKDVSEQRISWNLPTAGLVGVSALINLGLIGATAALVAVETSTTGLSSTPTVGLQVQRFVPGAGLTVIALNGSSLLTISAFSTSGPQAHVVTGTTYVIPGDVLQFVTSTASSAATYNSISVVLNILAAIRTDYGV